MEAEIRIDPDQVSIEGRNHGEQPRLGQMGDRVPSQMAGVIRG
jgi:hypothetical protein